MARLSSLYPRGPIDLGQRVRSLPSDGSVPGMPGWRWIFTPGHTAGHVSLWRDEDALLLAGDELFARSLICLGGVEPQAIQDRGRSPDLVH